MTTGKSLVVVDFLAYVIYPLGNRALDLKASDGDQNPVPTHGSSAIFAELEWYHGWIFVPPDSEGRWQMSNPMVPLPVDVREIVTKARLFIDINKVPAHFMPG